MKLVALVACLVLTACAEPKPTHYVVSISTMFTAEQQEAVIRGLDTWTAAIPELRVDIHVGDCDGTGVCVVPVEIGAGHAGREYGNETDHPTIGIDTAHANTAALVHVTAAHEFGHVMIGPEHTAASTLMATYVEDQATAPTAVDVARWHEVR
jgi:purine nucleoside permease